MSRCAAVWPRIDKRNVCSRGCVNGKEWNGWTGFSNSMDHPVEEDLSKVQCHFVDYSIKEEKEKERENGTEQEAVKSEKLKFPLKESCHRIVMQLQLGGATAAAAAA